jgi:hypothetical protein
LELDSGIVYLLLRLRLNLKRQPYGKHIRYDDFGFSILLKTEYSDFLMIHLQCTLPSDEDASSNASVTDMLVITSLPISWVGA